MSHSYVSNLMHCTFSTKARYPFIDSDLESRLWPYLGGIARENRMKALAIGGTTDHIHALMSLPGMMSFAKAVQLIKGGSSKWINDTFPRTKKFEWQEGYGAFSVSASQVPKTIAYNQQSERTSSEEDLPGRVSGASDETWHRIRSALRILNLSRPLHGLHSHCLSDPTDESVGYYHSSARADCDRLMCKALGVPTRYRWVQSLK